MHRNTRIDVWVWICIAAGVLVMRLFPNFVPELNHDSFQYLSAADNALAGRIGYTSLIHYDVERSFGVVPAPMLTFPSGYPLAIALVSLAGLSTVTAALILSVISTIGCIPLLAWMGVRLALSRAVRNVVLASFVFNGIVSEFGSAALSEAPFMFLVFLGVAALTGARSRGSTGGLRLWVAAGLAFGAAYFVRYAGLFFVAGLSLLLIRLLIARERGLAKGHAIALAVTGVFVTAGVVRNILIVGNWRGRDELVVSNPLLPVLVQTGRAMNALFLGVGTGTSAPGGTFIPKVMFSLLFVLSIVVLAWNRWRYRPPSAEPPPINGVGVGVDLLLLTATYAACMLYAGLTSEISYGTARNFVPLVPLILLLFGLALRILIQKPERRGTRLALAALVICFCCYVYLNLLVIRKPLADQVTAVAARLDASGESGPSARVAILSRVGPQGVVLANNGQATGFVLGRPTISMVGPAFSRVIWDEETVRTTIQRFHIEAIVISAPARGQTDDDDIPSPFVRQLAQGNPPAWLKLQHQSGAMLTYVPVSANP